MGTHCNLLYGQKEPNIAHKPDGSENQGKQGKKNPSAVFP
jgi:hypothetical protein